MIPMVSRLTHTTHGHAHDAHQEERLILPTNFSGNERNEESHADINAAEYRHNRRDFMLGEIPIGQYERCQNREIQFGEIAQRDAHHKINVCQVPQ